MIPLLKGKGTIDRDTLCWYYPYYQESTPAGAVRHNNWKLVQFYEDNTLELYDLDKDICETKNLAHDHPDKANELQKMLQGWLREVDAAMPTPNPNYDAKRAKERY
jgi:arylsulfatase A-like enzyme